MKRAWWVGLALGLVLRLAIAFEPLSTLDRWFIPDDTYYTLTLARAMARGLGPTLDGTVLSNGFQPLLAFLLVPVFWLTHGDDAPLRAALMLSALADVAVIVLLAKLAKRVAGPLAGALAAGLWAVSPLAIGNAFNGLETTLALACSLSLVLCWPNVNESGTSFRRWAVFGAFAGMSMLARVDTAFLLVLLAVLELGRRDARRWPGRFVALACALLVVGPWFGYSALRFGTVVPESGPALIALTRFHRQLYLATAQQLGWAAGWVLGAPFADLASFRDYLLPRSGRSVLAFLVTAGTLAALGLAWIRGSRQSMAAGAFALHALLLLGFYAFVVPALWFFGRYLAACQATLTLGIACWVPRALARRPSWSRRRALITRALPAVALLALFLIALDASAQFLLVTPQGSRRGGLHGTQGYREAARDVLAALPKGAVIGSMQSGALGYYAPPSMRVVNLDGVVNGEARRALETKRLSDYAKDRRVEYLVDWWFNLDSFARLSKASRAFPKQQRVPTRVKLQNEDEFIVVALHWPP